MHNESSLFTSIALLAALGLVACGSNEVPREDANVGDMEVALTNAPSDVSCLRLTVTGRRTDARSFPLTTGQNAAFRLTGLPVGNATVAAQAFAVPCNQIRSGTEPTWFSEPEVVRINVGRVTHVALAMIHNGRISVGVDFDEDNAPTPSGEPPLAGGAFSSQRAYLVPTVPGVQVRAIFTTGDSANAKPNGTPYRMVGIPDGSGAFDNGDGTFTWLVNHELGPTSGIPRAHGAPGAFVSKWKIRKADLAVLEGSDLIQSIALWDRATSSFRLPATGVAFGRLCSADLPAPSALFDVASGLGYDGHLFFDGEETGAEGRGFAHALDGTSWEIPRSGKFSWENFVPAPGLGTTTLAAGLDDSGGGQLYFYAGTKTNAGSPVDRAGLTNGVLYGLRAVGFPVEDPATGIPSVAFESHDFGNVENWTGAQLETESNTALVTKFQRPEDGAWDPNDPNHFYFVTTASITTASRLWRVRFTDGKRPGLGGRIEMLIEGNEGHRMFDNMTVDRLGHVYLQEDVGGNVRLGKVWRYDIATDALVEIAAANPEFFDPSIGSPSFITIDEESSGIIDASDLIGPGWFLLDMQVHAASPDPELVEAGQLLAIYDPAAAF